MIVTQKIGQKRNLTSHVIGKGLKVILVVVATTRQNSTHSLLTSAKLSVGYLVVKIVDSGLHSFLFSLFYLIFLFLLFSIFYF